MTGWRSSPRLGGASVSQARKSCDFTSSPEPSWRPTPLAGLIALLCVVSVVVPVAAARAAATPKPAVTATSATPMGDPESWTPAQAPMPTVLPNGQASQTMTLASTSCSSSQFCVAVGYATDSVNNSFPWRKLIHKARGPRACSCARKCVHSSRSRRAQFCFMPKRWRVRRFGIYGSAGGGNIFWQSALLEVLSGGVWTVSESVAIRTGLWVGQRRVRGL